MGAGEDGCETAGGEVDFYYRALLGSVLGMYNVVICGAGG